MNPMNSNTQQKTSDLYDLIDKANSKTKLPRRPLLDQAAAVDIKQALKPRDDSILHIILSMMHKATNDVLMISPNMAKRILEETNFPRQRKVRRSNVQKHLNRVLQGKWRGHDFPITFARIPATKDEPEKIWLINGQHRLIMISEYSKALPIKVIIAEAKDEDEAALLYTYFDTPDEQRSDMEVLDARGVTKDLDLPRQAIRAVYSALALLRNDLEPASYLTAEGEIARDRESRMEDIKSWENEAKMFWNDISRAEPFIRRKLCRSGVIALALFTYRYQPGRAHEFWNGVAGNDGLKKGDPRHALIADFMNRAMTTNSRIHLQGASIAWNAFCEKRELAIIKCIPSATIKVWGTPFANGNKK